MEIASIRAGTFRFVAPQSYLKDHPVQPGGYRFSVSIFLYCNQTSWLYDPVDWPEFVKDITSWGERYTENTLTIPAATTLKFAERIMPEGMARFPRRLAGTRSKSGPITLLDGNATSLCEPNALIYKGWKASTAATSSK